MTQKSHQEKSQRSCSSTISMKQYKFKLCPHTHRKKIDQEISQHCSHPNWVSTSHLSCGGKQSMQGFPIWLNLQGNTSVFVRQQNVHGHFTTWKVRVSGLPQLWKSHKHFSVLAVCSWAQSHDTCSQSHRLPGQS